MRINNLLQSTIYLINLKKTNPDPVKPTYQKDYSFISMDQEILDLPLGL
jgi:hypothetical protein